MRTVRATVLVLMSVLSAPVWAQPNGEPKKEEAAPKPSRMPRLREILRCEPTIREVQMAALRYYQLEPERIRRMASAARAKALLPEVEAGVNGMVGHTYNDMHDALFPTFQYKERNLGTSDQLVWNVRAVWDLPRAIFNPEQLDVKTLNSLQETLVREVTTLYFSRRRTVAALILSPPEDEEELFDQQQRLQELTATIDAFTGGQFSARAWNGDMQP